MSSLVTSGPDGECRHDGQLAFAQAEPGARVDVSERKLDHVPGDLREAPGELLHHLLSLLAVHLLSPRLGRVDVAEG